MDTAGIKQFVSKMDDALPRGNIFSISYSVTDKRTDDFYAHKRELIKLLQDSCKQEEQSRPPGSALSQREKTQLAMIKSFQRDLRTARDYTYVSDYTLDGIGFYLKQQSFFVSADGVKSALSPTIYASDGKIMGTFNLDQSQAALQPATERPQVPTPEWAEVAYNIVTGRLAYQVEKMQTLKIALEGDKLIITGERPGEKKEMTYLELIIDKANLRPLEMSITYYGPLGRLYNKNVKKWEYQDFNGVGLPKIVVDQAYETTISGVLKLEQERTFTINDFSPAAKSTKDSFKGLFKTNYSVFDEITGQHYMTGNPEEMLDKLSR